MYKKRNEIFDCNFVYFLILSLFVVIRIIASTLKVGTVMSYVLNATIQIGLCFSLSVFLFSYLRKKKIKNTLKDFGFKKINVKVVLISLILGFIVYCLTIFISTFFSTIISLLGYEQNGGVVVIKNYPLWLLFLELFATAVLPGICEEVANRGMIVSCYKKVSNKQAIIFSGLLFGLMHLNINQFFYATIIGFYFAFVALLSDNIWPTIIMHFTNNAIGTFMTYANANNLGIARWTKDLFQMATKNGMLIGILIMFVFVSILSFLMIWLTKVLCKETRVKQIASVADAMLKQELRNEIMKDIETAEVKEDKEDNGITLTSQFVGDKRVVNIDLSKQMVPYKKYKANKKDYIFMYANLFLGIVVTIMTFVWGVI